MGCRSADFCPGNTERLASRASLITLQEFMLHIDHSFLNQTVYLPVGQMMELRLRENPTTGFRWSFASDGGPSCTVIGDRFEQQNGPPGAGGEHAWQIKAVRAGKCHLEIPSPAVRS